MNDIDTFRPLKTRSTSHERRVRRAVGVFVVSAHDSTLVEVLLGIKALATAFGLVVCRSMGREDTHSVSDDAVVACHRSGRCLVFRIHHATAARATATSAPVAEQPVVLVRDLDADVGVVASRLWDHIEHHGWRCEYRSMVVPFAFVCDTPDGAYSSGNREAILNPYISLCRLRSPVRKFSPRVNTPQTVATALEWALRESGLLRWLLVGIMPGERRGRPLSRLLRLFRLQWLRQTGGGLLAFSTVAFLFIAAMAVAGVLSTGLDSQRFSIDRAIESALGARTASLGVVLSRYEGSDFGDVISGSIGIVGMTTRERQLVANYCAHLLRRLERQREGRSTESLKSASLRPVRIDLRIAAVRTLEAVVDRNMRWEDVAAAWYDAAVEAVRAGDSAAAAVFLRRALLSLDTATASARVGEADLSQLKRKRARIERELFVITSRTESK